MKVIILLSSHVTITAESSGNHLLEDRCAVYIIVILTICVEVIDASMMCSTLGLTA